jgi:hypothetical protein
MYNPFQRSLQPILEKSLSSLETFQNLAVKIPNLKQILSRAWAKLFMSGKNESMADLSY